MNLKALLQRKQDEKRQLGIKAKESQNADELRAINDKLDILNEEIRALEGALTEEKPDPEDDNQIVERTAIVNSQVPGTVITSLTDFENRNLTANIEEQIDQIADELRAGNEVSIPPEVVAHLEQRALDSSQTLIETHYSRNMRESFNTVPQLIDLVDSVPLNGGNSYSVPVEVDVGEGDYTKEDEIYEDAGETYIDVSTGSAKITAKTAITEEASDLPNVDYLTRAYTNIRKAIRRKISKQIVAGKGTATEIQGLYSQPVGIIPTDYKLELAEIDENTLSKIFFAYGADEDVESPTTLILSKKDLAGFESVKAKDGRSYYEIDTEKHTIKVALGGIKVSYTINSGCNSLSLPTTAVGTATMMYGDPMMYEMPIFREIRIRISEHIYADRGKIGIFGSAIIGGVGNTFKGFLPIYKATAQAPAMAPLNYQPPYNNAPQEIEPELVLDTLSVGSLNLSPKFSPEITGYTAITSNATNTVTATSDNADIEILHNYVSHPDGKITWLDHESGENIVTIRLTKDQQVKDYTVSVVKINQEETDN